MKTLTGSRPNDFMAKSSFKGRNGSVWVTTCPPPLRTCTCSLRHATKRLVSAAKNTNNEVEAFACFIDEDMLKQIFKHTNNRARRDLRAKGKNLDEWVPVDLCKTRSIVDLFIDFNTNPSIYCNHQAPRKSYLSHIFCL